MRVLRLGLLLMLSLSASVSTVAEQPLALAFPNLFNADVTKDKLADTQAYIEKSLNKTIKLEIIHNPSQLLNFCRQPHPGLMIWPQVHFPAQQCSDYRLLMVADFSLHLYHYKKSQQALDASAKTQILQQVKRLGLIKNTYAAVLAQQKYQHQTQVELVWFENYYHAFKALLLAKVDLVAAANLLPAALGGFWQQKLLSVHQFKPLSHTGLYVHHKLTLAQQQTLLQSLDGSRISAKAKAQINLGVTAYRPVPYNDAPKP